MCGRYRLKDPRKAFAWLEVVPSFEFLPRFNIAPAQRVPVVAAAGGIEEMAWGIFPVWAREKSKALINARSETIREKRSFKAAFTQRRCLVPADGFYEWSKAGGQPHFLTIGADDPFTMGAIWEPGPGGRRCCLLTTAANVLLAPFHNRMPVIVRREDWQEWCVPGELADASFDRITTPYPAGEMSEVTVSPLVNSARIDDPLCCEPAAPGAPPAIARKAPAKPDGQATFGF